LSAYINENSEIGLVCVHGVFGYRYQQKNGLLFRIGFTPLMFIPFKSSGSFMTSPWVGISFGYSL